MVTAEGMTKDRKPAEELRDKNISVWITAKQLEKAQAAAAAEKRSVSSWAQIVILQALEGPQKGRKK